MHPGIPFSLACCCWSLSEPVRTVPFANFLTIAGWRSTGYMLGLFSFFLLFSFFRLFFLLLLFLKLTYSYGADPVADPAGLV